MSLHSILSHVFTYINAEVEIPVASNLRPLCDKTFVASNQ